MKTFLCTICSVMVFTFCFSVTAFPAGNLDTAQTVAAKQDPFKPTQSRFSNMTNKQYLITGSVVAVSAATAAYCSGDTCSGIAKAISDAAPGMVAYFGLSTAISLFL